MNSITATKPRRISPARKPRLRVLSHSLDTTRHVQLYQDAVVGKVAIEVWTFAEWAKLKDFEKPDDYGLLPGIGFIHFHNRPGRDECADIESIVRQAWLEMEGGE